jgi:hypothetical protein
VAAPVVFDFKLWSGMFPELAGVGDAIAAGAFLRASVIFPNSATNRANRDGNLQALLYLLTAHVVFLNAPRDDAGNPASSGQAPPALVGRIASAGQGSVSVGVEWSGSGSPSEAWFTQTRYGAEFWQGTAQYRTGVYVARPTIVPSAVFPIRPFWGR